MCEDGKSLIRYMYYKVIFLVLKWLNFRLTFKCETSQSPSGNNSVTRFVCFTLNRLKFPKRLHDHFPVQVV